MSFEAKIQSAITPEAKAPAPVETPEQTSEEAMEAGFDEGHPYGEGGDSEPEGDQEEASEPEGVELDADAQYKIGDELVSGKELLARQLRQADYTKKTQAVAEERKAIAAKVEKVEDERDEVIHWAKSLENVDRMEYELQVNYPQTWEKLVDRILEQAIEESELTDPKAKHYYQASKRERLEKLAREADEEYQRTQSERKTYRETVATKRQQFVTWKSATLPAAGLDPNNEDHWQAVQDRLLAGYRNEEWTEAVFSKAAKQVAKALGVKEKAASAPKEEKKPELPAVRGAGHKAPPKVVQEQRAAKAAAARPKSFDELRKSFGIR